MAEKTIKLQAQAADNQKLEENPMSEFCESLMDLSKKCSDLRVKEDSAILIVSDGKTISSRMCGMRSNVLDMLYSQMLSDLDFAELIVQASMHYSHHLLGNRVAKKLDDCN